MENTKRLDYLDYAKGFGIILVVLGHIYDISNPIKIWLYSFHMPLFFIISGLLIRYTNINERDMNGIIVSKFKSLIIPYIFFELVAIFIWMCQNEFTLSALRWNVVDSILMYCKAGTTWFLFALFVSEIIFILLLKYIKSNKMITLITVILFLIPLIVKTENHNILVLFRCFIANGFLYVGYDGYDLLINRDIKFINIILLFFINIIFLYTICSILGSLSIIYLFKKLKQSRVLKYLGRNSLVIMGTHQILMSNFINRFTGGHYTYFNGILVLIGIIIIEIPIIEIINRYFPFVLGKFKKRKYIKVNI